MDLRKIAVLIVLAAASAGCDSKDMTGPGAPGGAEEILYQSSASGEYRVLSITEASAEPRLVFSDTFEIRGLAWSPSRSRITLASWRGGVMGLWSMDPQGGDLVPLTGAGETGEFPAWSPTGDRIAFHSSRHGNDEIYAMNTDGSGQTRLTDNQARDRFPEWSPDGSRIVFESSRGSANGYSDLWIMGADGSDPERLTWFDGVSPPSSALHGSWSPGADEIAFVGTSGESVFDVFVIGIDGNNLRNLTNDPGSYSGVDWSPDGSRIVFVADRSGNNDVWSMAPDGSDLVNLTDTPGEQETSPDW